MVEKLALKLVYQMELEGMISKEETEHYEYALVTMIERVMAVGSMLIIGAIVKQFIPTLCFLSFFLSLRKRTGGYHADKFWQCYLVTIITYIAITWGVIWLSDNFVVMCTMLFAAILVIEIIGTVNHPNMDMDKSELREAKKAARLLVILEVAVIAVLIYLGISNLYISYMAVAIILCASLLILAKILKQEVNDDETTNNPKEGIADSREGGS